MLQDRRETGLLRLLDLAGGLVGFLLLIKEVHGCFDSIVELGTLSLQVPELVKQPPLDLCGVDILDGDETFPVHVILGKSREKIVY